MKARDLVKMWRFNNLITTAIRLTVGIGLAYGLIHFTLKYTGTDLWNEVFNAKKSLLLLALLFYGAIIGVTIYRWNVLLRVQNVYLEPWDLVRLSMIGNFFNLVIPGAVSGDLLKMAFLTQHIKAKKLEAMLTVLLDRVLGLFGLFGVATIMLLFYLPFLADLEQGYRPIKIASLIIGLSSIVGVFGIVLVDRHQVLIRRPWISKLLDYGRKKLPASIVLAVERLVNALELYHRNRRPVVIAVMLSVLVHTCIAITLFVIGMSVQENALRLSDYLLASPVSSAVGAIPITPAGIGTRDATMTMFFIALKAPIEKAGVVPVILTVIILFWGLVGGIVFIITKVPNGEPLFSKIILQKEQYLNRPKGED